MSVGNKGEVVKRILDVVGYIEREQNSTEMELVKIMLVKIATSVLQSVSDNHTTNNCNGDAVKGGHSHGCKPHIGGSDQGSRHQSPQGVHNANNALPDATVQSTIEEIRNKIRGEEKNTDVETEVTDG